MFTSRSRFCSFLGPLLAPASATILLLALFAVENRGFNSGSALLIALAVATAAARELPTASLSFALAALAGQTMGLFPGVFESGALTYTAVPLLVFFAVLGLPSHRRWFGLFSAIVLAALTTAVWFMDSTWINYLFGSQVREGSGERIALQIFLVFAAFMVLTLTAWSAAYAVRKATASARAQAEAERRLERTATALEVEQDRNRISRELHDVLAHSLAVIIAQAEGLRYIHRSEPQAVDEAASVIADAARKALTETRDVLAGLQTDSNDPLEQRLAALAVQFSTSGMPVTLRPAAGPAVPTSPETSHAVYRLVQESLTNAFKHGDRGAGVEIFRTWTPDGLELGISSSTDLSRQTGQPLPPPGRGMRGMERRAADAGGWFTATADGGTFLVRAFLPLSADKLELEEVGA